MTSREQLAAEIKDIWEHWNCEYMSSEEEVEATLKLLDRELAEKDRRLKIAEEALKHGLDLIEREYCSVGCDPALPCSWCKPLQEALSELRK